MKITEAMILKDYNLLGLLDEPKRKKYLYLLKKHPEALKYFPNTPCPKELIDVSKTSLEFLNHNILSEDEIISILKKDGLEYRFLHPKRRANPKYIQAALKSDGVAIQYLPKAVPQTKELVDIAWKSNKGCFWNIEREFITKEMIYESVAYFSGNFYGILNDSILSDLIKDDQDFLKHAVKESSQNLRYIKNQNIEICLIALDSKKVEPELYSDINIVEAHSNEEAKALLLGKQEIINLMQFYQP